MLPVLVTLVMVVTMVTATVDCPLPGGPESASQSTCSSFPACQWTSGHCILSNNTGYSTQEVHVQHSGLELLLQQKDPDASMFGGDIAELRATSLHYDKGRMGLAIRDRERSRYEVPLHLNLPEPVPPPQQTEYSVNFSSPGQDFRFQVSHADTPVVTSLPELVYEDQFIEVTLLLGARDVYGFGENNHDSLRHDLAAGVTWPLFAHDHGAGFEKEAMYGVHPFFVGIEDEDGKSFGVLILNSNAMEYKLFLLDGKPALTYRTTGGILDFYFFFGSSPLEVLWEYHRTIGPSVMPPYWALGFQLSRWGYKDTQDIRDTRNRMKAAEIPQDVQYADIDYMDGRRDFTIDGKHFAGLPKLIKELREEEEVRFVLIFDPAIAADFGSYQTADQGKAADAFVKWLNSSLVPHDQCKGCGDYLAGHVWPASPTLYPNFLANRTVRWWTEQIKQFRALAGDPDGFWIDMNEPSCFDTNIGRVTHNSLRGGLQCPHTTLDYPPFPTSHTRGGYNPSHTLADHTICMSSSHDYDLSSQQQQQLRHYDVHSLYGWAEMRATRAAIGSALPGRRSLVVSRSTFVGSGRWGTHWTGDNTARWSDMKRSVVGILEFSMFGMPQVGADICGFNGATTEELCLRWTQLGAFYPFSRNHNAAGAPAQDPARWPSVAAAARDALGLRYRLLPFLYTLFWRASMLAETVTRPLAFQFPSDVALRDIDTQFLWGDAVMVAPILDEKSMTSVNVTFPAGGWFDLRDGSSAYQDAQSGQVNYDVPMSTMIPVFARSGTIIPLQTNATTTAASRRNPFQLAVFGNNARGELYWDDGESSDVLSEGDFYHCMFQFQNGTLEMVITNNGTHWLADPTINEVMFHGVSERPKAVEADGTAVDASDVYFDETIKRLTVLTKLDMTYGHELSLLY